MFYAQASLAGQLLQEAPDERIRKKYRGKIVIAVIYEYLDPNAAKRLKERAPKPHWHCEDLSDNG